MTDDNKISITIKEYNWLRLNERMLNALHEFGVEDWEEYEDAILSLEEEKGLEEEDSEDESKET